RRGARRERLSLRRVHRAPGEGAHARARHRGAAVRAVTFPAPLTGTSISPAPLTGTSISSAPLTRGEASGFCERGVLFSRKPTLRSPQFEPRAHDPLLRGSKE